MSLQSFSIIRSALYITTAISCLNVIPMMQSSYPSANKRFGSSVTSLFFKIYIPGGEQKDNRWGVFYTEKEGMGRGEQMMGVGDGMCGLECSGLTGLTVEIRGCGYGGSAVCRIVNRTG